MPIRWVDSSDSTSGSDGKSGMRVRHTGSIILFGVLLTAATAGAAEQDISTLQMVIPRVTAKPSRPVTIDDVAQLRYIKALVPANDGRRFAVLVTQADPTANRYLAAWFIGDVQKGTFTHAGAAGDIEPSDGSLDGGHTVQWSPDNLWIAYTLKKNGEIQLWRSSADGRARERLTRNEGDVNEFRWSEDGRSIIFTTGPSRAHIRAEHDAKAKNGYSYHEDLMSFMDLMPRPHPPFTSSRGSRDCALWMVTLPQGREQLLREKTCPLPMRVGALRYAEFPGEFRSVTDAEAASTVERNDGARVRLERVDPSSSISLKVRLSASLAKGGRTITCTAAECSGFIRKAWWNSRGDLVLFSRDEGVRYGTTSFYAWSPRSGSVSAALRSPDDVFMLCSPVVDDQMVCGRENSTTPLQLVLIDFRTGAMRTFTDLNPEFHAVVLGRVEHFGWDLPSFRWNEPGGQLEGVYDEAPYGYIFFPSDFDPKKKYPVIIEPYAAHGFEPSAGSEHSLHNYAAHGFLVLSMSFPRISERFKQRLTGIELMRQLYAEELNFPLLSMLTESTLCGLDAAARRGYIDDTRVGIGGTSHGTFVPLYMMQLYDRLAAISISGPGWGAYQDYLFTRRGREPDLMGPDYRQGGRNAFWSKIDVADHVEKIEAPVLMNIADQEMIGMLRLLRQMDEANKPYDIFVFPQENHFKWQPAHLYAIMTRNLDWFLFWLQGIEDHASGKQQQYGRWRKLRNLQSKDAGVFSPPRHECESPRRPAPQKAH
jgi:dipeptidyl aminopeptidase/acylaminoacyl peptidase